MVKYSSPARVCEGGARKIIVRNIFAVFSWISDRIYTRAMQQFRTKITKRKIKQKNREGKVFVYDRYILHYLDPATKKRRMERYDTRKEAEAAQNELIRNYETLARQKSTPPTLREAVDYWLKSKQSLIRPNTMRCYKQTAFDFILGPYCSGSYEQKAHYKSTLRLLPGAELIPMLGFETRIDEITTAELRLWYQRVMQIGTPYVARVAKKHLSSIFRLIEEDFGFRLCRMPSRPGPVYRRKRRELLSEDQVKLIFEEAQRDPKWGLYYLFPFLTGVRPSEMLGLLWKNVDLARGRIYIYATQDLDGSLKEFTKTDAGMREIPMNLLLQNMLIEWQQRCPRLNGKLHRVFPSQPHEKFKGRRLNEDSEGGLSLSNYRMRVWFPMLDRLGLPRIAIYAARHMAISYLQAQGVEIGLVAKIAGHSSPQITLQYYTHAVREREGMMDELSKAYGLENRTNPSETSVQ